MSVLYFYTSIEINLSEKFFLLKQSENFKNKHVQSLLLVLIVIQKWKTLSGNEATEEPKIKKTFTKKSPLTITWLKWLTFLVHFITNSYYECLARKPYAICHKEEKFLFYIVIISMMRHNFSSATINTFFFSSLLLVLFIPFLLFLYYT